jgi:hypothetical protein
MPIPPLTPRGLLPAGIHDCTLPELEAAFGGQSHTSPRRMMTGHLSAYLAQASRTPLIRAVYVDGSYAAACETPHDIDVVVVLSSELESGQVVPPWTYNLISRRRAARRFGLDLYAAAEESEHLKRLIEFLQEDRDGTVKGILRLIP